MVKAGDVLFRLDDRAIRAMIDKDQAQLAKDQASLVAANLDLSSAQDLEKRHVDTNQQVYQAEAAVKVLEASIAMDKAQIDADQVQLSYMTITAPIDGRVGVVNTSVGNSGSHDRYRKRPSDDHQDGAAARLPSPFPKATCRP